MNTNTKENLKGLAFSVCAIAGLSMIVFGGSLLTQSNLGWGWSLLAAGVITLVGLVIALLFSVMSLAGEWLLALSGMNTRKRKRKRR